MHHKSGGSGGERQGQSLSWNKDHGAPTPESASTQKGGEDSTMEATSPCPLCVSHRPGETRSNIYKGAWCGEGQGAPACSSVSLQLTDVTQGQPTEPQPHALHVGESFLRHPDPRRLIQ